jgi:hypothetical protein
MRPRGGIRCKWEDNVPRYFEERRWEGVEWLRIGSSKKRAIVAYRQ